MEHKTREKFARLICLECKEFDKGDGVRYLTEEQYNQQMGNPNKGWACPYCHTYPCYWDDDYFELPLL